MNDYKRAVLSVIAKDSDYVGWYKIEQRLSIMPLLERGYLPDILKQLLGEGCIEESSKTVGMYRATPLGRSVLERNTGINEKKSNENKKTL